MRNSRNSKVFAAALVASMAVLAATAEAWDTPTDISGPGYMSYQVQLAVDGKGRTVALWSEPDSSDHYRVVAALRQPGQSFGGPAQLSAAGEHAVGEQVAVSKKGHIAVAWVRGDASHPVLQVAAAAPGAAVFGAPVDASPESHSATSPHIAMDARGNTTVVWENTAENYRPYAASRPVGGTFGGTTALSTADSNGLQLIEDAKGNAIAIWYTFDGQSRVEASVRLAGGSFAPAQTVNDPSTPGFSPGGAYDRKGNAFVGWGGSGATLAAGDSTFGIPVPNPVYGYPSTFAFDRKGNLSALSGATAYSYRPLGGEFSSPTEINTPGAILGKGSMAIDSKGNVRITWTEDSGSGSRVWTALRPVGGTFGLPEPLSDAEVDAYSARVVFDRKGNATVAWVQTDTLGNQYVMVTNLPK